MRSAIISFALMLLALTRCEAQQFMMVGPYQVNSKGGEAQGKQLSRHHRSPHASLRKRHALSVAVPRPRPNLELLHPERYPKLTPGQGRALADEVFRTPQERLVDAFQQLEEAYAKH